MATDHDFELINKPVHRDNFGLKENSPSILEHLTADSIRPIPPKTTHHKSKLRRRQHVQTTNLSLSFQQLKIRHTELFDVNPPPDNKVLNVWPLNTNRHIFK